MLNKSFISSIFDKTNLEAGCLDILNVAEPTMIATFFDGKGGSTTYELGDNMSLQDALNATRNNHFAPTLVVLTNLENTFKEGGETVILENTSTQAQLGKHSFDDVLAKHKISHSKLDELVSEGAEHEMEHTDNYRLAIAIATDHLYEHLDYYKRLKQVNLAYGGLLKYAKGVEVKHKSLEVEVYVPSTDVLGEPVSDSEMAERVQEVSRAMTKMFGGSVIENKFGGYQKHDGQIVNEKIVCVKSFASSEDWSKHKRTFAHKVSQWAMDWGQESVGVEYNETLYYIASHYKDELAELDNILMEEI